MSDTRDPWLCAHVFLWEDAPVQYKELSTNGGDEDWLVLVPDRLYDKCSGWLPWLDAIGVCKVEEHKVINGRVYIGCHA